MVSTTEATRFCVVFWAIGTGTVGAVVEPCVVSRMDLGGQVLKNATELEA